MQNNTHSHPLLMAIVGMPGSGKSETSVYVEKQGFKRIRFGDVTEEGLKKQGLAVTPEHEETYRLEMRKELGMAAYAIRSEEKISQFLRDGYNVVIDGLYSWEEYLYMKKKFSHLLMIHVFARPDIRYDRLSVRSVRPFTREESEKRDISEIEKLNKGGPIAMADFQVVNESSVQDLHEQLNIIITHLAKNG